MFAVYVRYQGLPISSGNNLPPSIPWLGLAECGRFGVRDFTKFASLDGCNISSTYDDKHMAKVIDAVRQGFISLDEAIETYLPDRNEYYHCDFIGRGGFAHFVNEKDARDASFLFECIVTYDYSTLSWIAD